MRAKVTLFVDVPPHPWLSVDGRVRLAVDNAIRNESWMNPLDMTWEETKVPRKEEEKSGYDWRAW